MTIRNTYRDIGFATAVLVAVGIVAFGMTLAKGAIKANQKDNSKFHGYSNYSVIQDEETGCEYILGAGGFYTSPTPRLDSEGKQICTQKPRPPSN